MLLFPLKLKSITAFLSQLIAHLITQYCQLQNSVINTLLLKNGTNPTVTPATFVSNSKLRGGLKIDYPHGKKKGSQKIQCDLTGFP